MEGKSVNKCTLGGREKIRSWYQRKGSNELKKFARNVMTERFPTQGRPHPTVCLRLMSTSFPDRKGIAVARESVSLIRLAFERVQAKANMGAKGWLVAC